MDFCHERKFDGFRCTAVVAGGSVRLLSRKGQRFNSRFPGIAQRVQALGLGDSQLDGEVIAVDADRRDNFDLLQQSLDGGRVSAAALAYVAFDLMRFEGIDLTKCALLDRKTLLSRLLEGSEITYSTHVIGHGTDAFRTIAEQGGEGIVSKRIDAPYPVGRSRSWLKIMARQVELLAVVGWMSARGTSSGGYMVGRLVDGELRYAGRVNSGLDARERALLRSALQRTPDPTVRLDPYLSARAARIRWFRPTVIFQVAYRTLTSDGHLRHPSILAVQRVT